MYFNRQNVRTVLARKEEEVTKTSEKLTNVSDLLSQLYHHVCLTNGDQPELVHLKSIKNKVRYYRRHIFQYLVSLAYSSFTSFWTKYFSLLLLSTYR